MKTLVKVSVLSLVVALSACATNDPVTQAEATRSVQCEDPRPQMCTMEYMPVCGVSDSGEKKTYATGCMACSDTNVTHYLPDACPE